MRHARVEEMQHVKKHARFRESPMLQCWEETEKNLMRTGLADQQLNVPVPELEVSVFFLERSTGPRAALFSATSLLNVKKNSSSQMERPDDVTGKTSR